jgi:hypothetical protein
VEERRGESFKFPDCKTKIRKKMKKRRHGKETKTYKAKSEEKARKGKRRKSTTNGRSRCRGIISIKNPYGVHEQNKILSSTVHIHIYRHVHMYILRDII